MFVLPCLSVQPKTVASFVPLFLKLSTVAVLLSLPMCINNPKGSFFKETKSIDLPVTVLPLPLSRSHVRHDNVRRWCQSAINVNSKAFECTWYLLAIYHDLKLCQMITIIHVHSILYCAIQCGEWYFNSFWNRLRLQHGGNLTCPLIDSVQAFHIRRWRRATQR